MSASQSERSLVLASTSPYRRELLARLGVPFEAVAPDVDERAPGPRNEIPDALALRLARAKATRVAMERPGAYVLGSDQVVDLDGDVLGKPGDEARAIDQLARLSGRAHRLVTAVALVYPDGRLREAIDVHRMHVRPLAPEVIVRYVRAERPLDCAGAYKIEGRGIALFSRIEGDDFTAIVGLPLLTVIEWLTEAGFSLPP